MGLNEDVQEYLATAGEVLKKKNPEFEFVFILVPFARVQLQHLSTEQRKTLEKRMVRAAHRAFNDYVADPD